MEQEAEEEKVRERVEAELKGDVVARRVFRCLCDGIGKREEIAAALGLPVRAVTDARRRLENGISVRGLVILKYCLQEQ